MPSLFEEAAELADAARSAGQAAEAVASLAKPIEGMAAGLDQAQAAITAPLLAVQLPAFKLPEMQAIGKPLTCLAALFCALALGGCIEVPPGYRIASICVIGTDLCWRPAH